MICEQCRNEIADSAMICPICGNTTQAARQGTGERPSQPMGGYGYGYGTQQSSTNYTPPMQGYNPPQQQQGYMQPPQPQGYGYGGVNVNIIQQPVVAAPAVNTTPVLVEVLLNIFLGLFGVGWLMAGETTAGIIMLICGYVVYWPIFVVLSIFSFGIADCLLIPLHITLLIVNPIMLNNHLKKKALQQQVVVVQTR